MFEAQKRGAVDATLNAESPVISVAPAASETITRSKMDLYTRVTTPASGVGVLAFPYPQEALIGQLYHVYCPTDGGGEVKIANPAGTDIIGDNIGAVADEVVFFSNGYSYVVLKDTTN